MKKEYDEIMEHIEVTQEMRRRVLERIAREDMAPARAEIMRFRSLKKYLSAAACLIFLLAGAAALTCLPERTEPEQPPVFAVSNIEEAGSLGELSELVGFEVTAEFHLPFEAEETTYCSYWNELAEVAYSGEGCRAVYRQSLGSGDNSGDYNIYNDVVEITAGGLSVTLKGNGGIYSLAVWTDGTYACSLSLSPGEEREVWQVSLAP